MGNLGPEPIEMYVDAEGRTWGGVGDWAKRHSITMQSAYQRLRRLQIDYYRQAFCYEEADYRWKANATRTDPDEWRRMDEQEAALRVRMKAAGIDEKMLDPQPNKYAPRDNAKKGPPAHARRPTEKERRDQRLLAIERMLGVKKRAAAESAGEQAASEASEDTPDLAEFSTGQEAPPTAAPTTAAPEPETVGLRIEDIDTLGIDEFMERLLVTTGMNHKMAAEYFMKMVQVKHGIHDLRKEIASLVPLQEVRDFEANVLTDLRNALLPIGGELRDDLAACSDPVRCQEMVDARIYGALRQVSEYKVKMQQVVTGVAGPAQSTNTVQ